MNPTAFRPLGHSGLIVGPLCLGTMTFGTPRWGSSDDISSLSLRLSEEHLRALDEVSALAPASPYPLFEAAVNRSIFGGMTVQGGV